MEGLDFSKNGGLIPAVVQDWKSGEVLMVGFMNEEAFLHTTKTGKATYFSRSRGKLWVKGESSGNEQLVKEIYTDCDMDTVVLKVEQKGGAACHLGYRSCFFRKKEGAEWRTMGEPLFDPERVYKKG